MCEFEHLAVISRIAVRVDDRIAAQVIALENAPDLCRSRTITVRVPTGEPAITFLKLRADEFHTDAVRPGLQVGVQGRGHDDNGIALVLMPLDALKRPFTNDRWKRFRRVSAANLLDRVRELALEANSGDDWPRPMCRHQAESITEDNRAERKHSQNDTVPAHGEAEETGECVALGDCAIEIK